MADVDTISAFNAALARETEARTLDGHLLQAGSGNHTARSQ